MARRKPEVPAQRTFPVGCEPERPRPPEASLAEAPIALVAAAVVVELRRPLRRRSRWTLTCKRGVSVRVKCRRGRLINAYSVRLTAKS